MVPDGRRIQRNNANAGFWGEVLFRAVPLAGAVLIAKKFRRKGLWIAFALLIQAVIFGSMHANYAQQPAYARIVEMIIPFCLYGLIYINWGLLPVIISHFVYDILLMSLPLFIMSAPGIWIHRVLVILVMMIPLGVVIFRRIKAGSWYEICEADLNAGYIQPETIKEDRKKEESRNLLQEHRELPVVAAIILLIIGAAAWTWLTPFEQDVPQLKISRQKAVKIAESFVKETYPGTDSLDYHHYVRIESGIGREGRFVWEKGNRDIFRKLYADDLATNYFMVTFKTFEGDIVKRSETIDVNIGRTGEILGWTHRVPEPRPDQSLDEQQAIALAEKAITDHFGKDVAMLELVKTEPEKLTARTDWTVIYRNTGTGLSEGDIRYTVRISGQELSGMDRMVHTSENWDREQKKSSVLKIILLVISKLIQFGMLITVVILGIVAWTKKHFNVRLFVYFFLGFVIISLLQGVLMANSIIGQYPTSEPYGNLILMLVIGVILGAAVSSFIYAVPIGYMARIPLHVQRNEHVIGIKGTGLGLVLAAGLAFTAGNVINQQPLVMAPLDLEAMHPLFASFLSAMEDYFITLVMLMVPLVIVERVSDGWKKRNVVSLVLLFLAGFSYVGKLSLGWWVLGGSIMGVLLIGLYIWVLRYNMIYVPVMTAALLVLDQLQYLFADPATLTIHHVVLTSVVTVLLSVFAVWGMYRIRILQPKKPLAPASEKPETA